VESLVDYKLDLSAEFTNFQDKPTVYNELRSAIGQNDILIAGPPCQGFSNLNNKTRRADDRNELYFRVPAAALALDSKIVIIENVKEILSDPRKIVERAKFIAGNRRCKTDIAGVCKIFRLAGSACIDSVTDMAL
jgi:DNA (cytosine-5)-methyltransferase 1